LKSLNLLFAFNTNTLHKEDLKQLFSSFDDLNVLIIGDVMVDSYLWGKVDRISPEAPVPIVSVDKRENRLGGAANVALNVKSMGANPILCSVIGDDAKGEEFIALLEKDQLPVFGIVQSTNRITTTKFRVIGNNVQMLRVDEEVDTDLLKADKEGLIRRINQIIDQEKIDVIIFQDYDKGIIDNELIRKIVAKAKTNKIPVTVDPKKKNFNRYKDVTLFKPNLKELKEGLNTVVDVSDINSIKKATAQLKALLNTDVILITMSEYGVFVEYDNGNDKSFHIIPSFVRSISDVSGAGDTVISVASLCVACNIDSEQMAFISNMAGGLVCEKVGVVPVDREELLKEIILHKGL